MPRAWYAHRGGTFGTDLLSGFYRIDGIPGCSDGNQLCAIYAEIGGANPARISNNLQRYIANGLAKFIAQPDNPGAKIFATFKSPS